jgi:hypothetical protein
MGKSESGPDTSSLPWGPIDDPVEALVADLRAVRHGGTIRILAGEASPAVYSDPAVIEAATYAKRERGATLRVSVGPVLVTAGGPSHGLNKLSRQGVIDSLTARPTRGSTGHYRIVETDDGYRYHEELPHPPRASQGRRKRLLVERLPNGHLAELAKARCEQFDRLTIANGNADERPLLLSPFGFDTLLRIAAAPKQDFNMLTGAELRTMLLQSDLPWSTVDRSDELYSNQWILMKVAAFDHRTWPWFGKIVGHFRHRSEISSVFEQELYRQTPRTHGILFIYRAWHEPARG